MRAFLLLSIAVFSFHLSTFAADSLHTQQAAIEPSPWSIYSGWLTLGMGLNLSNRGADIEAGTITFRQGLAVTLRRGEAFDRTGHHRIEDFALMVGRRFSPSPSVVITTALGPAWSRDHRDGLVRGNYGWDEVDLVRETEGAAGQVEVILPLMVRVGGLGLTVYGNANPRYSFAAFAVTFHLGFIR
jgi:hypothetical protein